MKTAAIRMENIIIAVLLCSAFFGYIFVNSLLIGDTYIANGMNVDKNNYGMMTNANTSTIQADLQKIEDAKNVSAKVEESFEQLNPSFSFDGLTSIYKLAWNTVLLIKTGIANLFSIMDVATQIIGVDVSVASIFSTILVIVFLVSIILLLLGRST